MNDSNAIKEFIECVLLYLALVSIIFKRKGFLLAVIFSCIIIKIKILTVFKNVFELVIGNQFWLLDFSIWELKITFRLYNHKTSFTL